MLPGARVKTLKVDELLANIRKSVDSDMEGLSGGTTSQARGTLMRGALREMRISMGVEAEPAKPAVREEISDLRSRIKQKVEEAALHQFDHVARPETQAPKPAPAPRGDFSGIMTAPSTPQRPPALRPSFDHHDARDDLRYVPLPPPSEWQAEDDAQFDDPYQQQETYAEQGYGYDEQAYHQPYQQPALEAPLMSRQSQAQTESAFQQLSDALLARATGDRSLEEMTRDMLRSMLKQWLDANLPGIVEDMVREEIQRVARRGR